MTERERREKGLSPSPAQLAVYESIQKDAEAQMEKMAMALQPVMAAMQEPARRIAAMAEEMSKAIAFDYLHEPKAIIPAVLHMQSRTVRLAPDQFEALIPQKMTNELMYDWKGQELSRIAMGQKISFSFVDKKDNKRRRLVEKLMRTQKFVETKTLESLLSLPEKQVGNMVAAINDMVGVALTLSESLIDGKRGKGYRINPAYMLYQKK